MICECGGNASFTEDSSLLICDRCGYGTRVPVTRTEAERLLAESAVCSTPRVLYGPRETITFHRWIRESNP